MSIQIVIRNDRFEFDGLGLKDPNIAGHGFTYDFVNRVWYTLDYRHLTNLQSFLSNEAKIYYLTGKVPALEYADEKFVFTHPQFFSYYAKDAGFIRESNTKSYTYDWQVAKRLTTLLPELYTDVIKLWFIILNSREKEQVQESHNPGVKLSLPVPAGLDYLPYQKAGILYASEREASIIGDEMGCIAGDAKLEVVINHVKKTVTMEKLYSSFQRNSTVMYTRSYHKGKLYLNEIVNVLDKGVKDVLEVQLINGVSLKLTADHEVLTEQGQWIEARKLTRFDRVLVSHEAVCLMCGKRGTFSRRAKYPGVCRHCARTSFKTSARADMFYARACKDTLVPLSKAFHAVESVQSVRVGAVVPAGQTNVYDIVMKDPARNFVVNSIVVHNCGKTIQAIGAVNLSKLNKPKVLITTLASLKLNWQRECEKWFTKNLNIQVLSGRSIVRQADVYIINYDVLDRHEDFLVNTDWDFIIMDEAHELRNRSSKRTKVMYKIQGKQKIALTGTPVPNRPEELYGLLNYLQPGKWGTHDHFTRQYCGRFKNASGFVTKGASNLDDLSRLLRSRVMIRRLKADVLPELPEKIYQIIPMSGAQDLVEQEKQLEQMYAAKESALNTELLSLEKSTAEYKRVLSELKSQRIMKMSEMARMARLMGIEKTPQVIQYVQDIIEGDPEHKLVLFATHKAVIEKLVEAFGKKCVSITGDTSMDARQRAVDAFQNDPSVNVFIGNIKAAGTGITLTSAHHVVFAEFDWVPGLMQQAVDRCHRIGSKNTVLVQYLAYDHSIDAHKLKTLDTKEKVQDQLLNTKVVA